MISFKDDLLFWCGIMRDHALFQFSTLSPKEIVYIQRSMYFYNFFESMIHKIQASDNTNFFRQTLSVGVISFMEHKKSLLSGLLSCQIQMSLPPSLINHQINEAMEFMSLLTSPSVKSVSAPSFIVRYIKIWLADSIGHASGIVSFLDPAEGLLSQEALMFKEKFTMLSVKASEMEDTFEKVSFAPEPLKLLAEETIEWMTRFICYLEKVKKLRLTCKAMAVGTLIPLVPDHFIREHKYFIEKIKAYTMD